MPYADSLEGWSDVPESSDSRADFDPGIAEQVSSLILTAAINSMQLNAATGRNLLSADTTVLTTGVQLVHQAALRKQVTVDPQEAAAAADLQRLQRPVEFASLNGK